jgi:hypothetical protein
MVFWLKGTVSRDFLLQVFFMNQLSLKPPKITLGSFRILLKIRGDIRKSKCTTGINDTGCKFATGGKLAAGVNYTNGKFATGINDTGGNFATGTTDVVDTGGNFATGVNETGGKFAACVNDTGGK